MEIIESFSYLGFEGPIRMKAPEETFVVHELWSYERPRKLEKIYFGRFVIVRIIDRELIPLACQRQPRCRPKVWLKSQELCGKYLIWCWVVSGFCKHCLGNPIAKTWGLCAHRQANPAMFIYDPFCGTGSFLYACSHFGALTCGDLFRKFMHADSRRLWYRYEYSWSELISDGRNIRGKGSKSVKSNFAQYGLEGFYLDSMTFDLTHNPFRLDVLFDAIICDRKLWVYFPDLLAPYGVRAGAKKLGSRKTLDKPIIRSDGSIAHTLPPLLSLYLLTWTRQADFVFPTVVYELSDVLGDLMSFAASHLKHKGRLVFWMPLIRDTIHPQSFPEHRDLHLISSCEQAFNQCKWSQASFG